MASFAEQIAAAEAAHAAVAALEQTARARISQAFSDWENGKITDRDIRTQTEAIVRSAYRASVTVGHTHTAEMAELGAWVPQTRVFNTEYLAALLKDVRRNLKEYKKSERTEVDRRRVVLRIQHSAGVGAEQGYTDAIIAGAAELEDFGYELEKYWVANFKGNLPCKYCRKLHGTGVPLHEEFKHPGGLKIYLHLQGAPLHPRCQCKIIVLIRTLENAFETPDFEEPDSTPAPVFMTTDQVKTIPQKIFDALRKVLKVVAKKFRKKKK